MPPLSRFLISCPSAIFRSPAINDAFIYRRHWEHGALGVVFPAGAPVIVVEAVAAVDAGLTAGQVERFERDRKKATS
jgi:hypothetical protein